MNNKKIYVSFVVDKLALHYYQAELLLYSLEKFAGIDKKNIVVQCLNRVDKYFLDYLKENEYVYNIIEPYLDGKYSNKLQQLEYFFDKEIDAVLLLDTDMFIAAPFDFSFDNDYIYAKVVDGPNPDISTLKQIYQEADLKQPNIIESDWKVPGNETFANNFNGGLYLIPFQYIKTVSIGWKKWGQWLFNNKNIFNNKKQHVHIDQISFSLMLEENQLKYRSLPTNYNYPTHKNRLFSFYDKNEAIKILHYHRELDRFGLLKKEYFSKDQAVYQTISLVNQAISAKEEFIFFESYKKSISQALSITEEFNNFKKKFMQFKELKKIKIVIHGGTPKTGTSSIQKSLYDNYEINLENGFYYPNINLHRNPPKHQWLVGYLRNNDFEKILQNFEEIEAEIVTNSKIHTIILSTEGIYNHWWDFSNEAKLFLRSMSDILNIEYYFIFREPESFMKSYYKQIVKNPKNKEVQCYGTTLTCFELLEDDEWFKSHLDYYGFLCDLQQVCSNSKINTDKYDKNIITLFYETLGIPLQVSSAIFENSGLSMCAIEILRKFNNFELTHQDRDELVILLHNCCNQVVENSNKYDRSTLLVSEIFSTQRNCLSKEFHLDFTT